LIKSEISLINFSSATASLTFLTLGTTLVKRNKSFVKTIDLVKTLSSSSNNSAQYFFASVDNSFSLLVYYSINSLDVVIPSAKACNLFFVASERPSIIMTASKLSFTLLS
jgi:hypothetical protein